MIRVFVAFPIKNETAEQFLKVSEKNTNIENIRWTPTENLHITLFFIGEILEANLQNVTKALDDACLPLQFGRQALKVQREFALEFDSIIIKGKKSKPSMIWAQYRKDEFFTTLSEKIFQSVKEYMTIEVVHKDPVPHCTLARIKSNADVSAINTDLNLIEKRLTIDSAELWKTVQTKDGVRYEALKRLTFQ